MKNEATILFKRLIFDEKKNVFITYLSLFDYKVPKN